MSRRKDPGPPPPINWATRPSPRLTTSTDNAAATGAGSRPPVEVLIDPDHLDQLHNLLRLLNPPAHPQPVPESQEVDMQNLRGLLRHLGYPNVPRHTPQSEVQEDACLDGSDTTPEIEQLASAFSSLSTSTTSFPTQPTASGSSALPNTSALGHLPAARIAPIPIAPMIPAVGRPLSVRIAPGSATSVSPMSSPKKLKYYVIVFGKCAGIYYDEWENVISLIHKVPGAIHKSFSTYKLAEEYYLHAKMCGRVGIARNPGDDEIYGPRELAIQ